MMRQYNKAQIGYLGILKDALSQVLRRAHLGTLAGTNTGICGHVSIEIRRAHDPDTRLNCSFLLYGIFEDLSYDRYFPLGEARYNFDQYHGYLWYGKGLEGRKKLIQECIQHIEKVLREYHESH